MSDDLIVAPAGLFYSDPQDGMKKIWGIENYGAIKLWSMKEPTYDERIAMWEHEHRVE